MNNLARLSPPGANGICFNPSLSGGSMLEPSPSLCGAFAGLKLSNNRGDIIRATMEGITLNLKKALQVLQSYAQVKGNMLIVGGGAKVLSGCNYSPTFMACLSKNKYRPGSRVLRCGSLSPERCRHLERLRTDSRSTYTQRHLCPRTRTATILRRSSLPPFPAINEFSGTIL